MSKPGLAKANNNNATIRAVLDVVAVCGDDDDDDDDDDDLVKMLGVLLKAIKARKSTTSETITVIR